MKKTLLLSLMLINLNAAQITKLLDAVSSIPDTKIDNLMVKEAKTNKKSVEASLMPTLTLNASMEHFNSPVSLKQLTPTLSASLIQTNSAIPFSKNILKVGFNVSMPVFIKEIYDNKTKISHLINSTKYQAKINLLKKEALLITLVSKLNYLYSLKKALETQKNSIQETLKGIKVGVKVGRIPEFKLLRLKDSLNNIDISISNINTNIYDTQAKIYNLTQIKTTAPVEFTSNQIKKGEFIYLKPLKEQLKASEYDVKIAKDKNLPKLLLKIQGYRAYAKAYNNDASIHEDLASVGIYISWDVFNKKNSSTVQKAKISKLKSSLQIQKTLIELNSQITSINNSLKELKRAILQAKNSIELKQQLLKSAKTAFKLNTMTVDEYLKYEDDLAKAKANLANLIATKNSLLAQKALIYGNNLKKVFK
ncbi:MAG: TolC family protein [Nautiliaceae bacterium]